MNWYSVRILLLLAEWDDGYSFDRGNNRRHDRVQPGMPEQFRRMSREDLTLPCNSKVNPEDHRHLDGSECDLKESNKGHNHDRDHQEGGVSTDDDHFLLSIFRLS